MLKTISHSYFFIVILALLIGVVFASEVVFLAPYATLFLGGIFFLSALTLDLKEIYRQFDDKKLLLVVNLMMLVVLPVLIYFLTDLIYPSLAIPFLLLAAMPAGMTAPLLTDIIGGRQSLALVLTVLTSLLAPFTVPLVMSLLVGTEIEISVGAMILSLVQVIFIPFILAHIIRHYFKSLVIKTAHTYKSISILLLGLLIIGIVAKQADVLVASISGGGTGLIILLALFIFFIVLHVLGYLTVFWRHAKDRLATTVCLTYMNFTLAIYLADTFFPREHIVVPVILSVIPWSLLLIPFKKVASGRV